MQRITHVRQTLRRNEQNSDGESSVRSRRWLDDDRAVITHRLPPAGEQGSPRMYLATHDFRESPGLVRLKTVSRRTRWWSLRIERSRKWSTLRHPRRVFPISLEQRLSQRRSRASENVSRRFTLLSPARCFATVDPCRVHHTFDNDVIDIT